MFAVDSQYTDKSDRPASYAQTYKGGLHGHARIPWLRAALTLRRLTSIDQIPLEFGGTPTAVCLTSAQLATQLEAFIAGSTGSPREWARSTTCSHLPA